MWELRFYNWFICDDVDGNGLPPCLILFWSSWFCNLSRFYAVCLAFRTSRTNHVGQIVSLYSRHLQVSACKKHEIKLSKFYFFILKWHVGKFEQIKIMRVEQTKIMKFPGILCQEWCKQDKVCANFCSKCLLKLLNTRWNIWTNKGYESLNKYLHQIFGQTFQRVALVLLWVILK